MQTHECVVRALQSSLLFQHPLALINRRIWARCGLVERRRGCCFRQILLWHFQRTVEPCADGLRIEWFHAVRNEVLQKRDHSARRRNRGRIEPVKVRCELHGHCKIAGQRQLAVKFVRADQFARGSTEDSLHFLCYFRAGQRFQDAKALGEVDVLTRSGDGRRILRRRGTAEKLFGNPAKAIWPAVGVHRASEFGLEVGLRSNVNCVILPCGHDECLLDEPE